MRFATAVVLVMVATAARSAGDGKPAIEVLPHESERRVDILVDGKPFTSYIWPESLTKPVLFPIVTAKGTTITRGYPLEPRAGERTDHPHQVGLWLSYGDVNGIDFWNNSAAVPGDQRAKMGRGVHRRIVQAASGKDEGHLRVAIEWTRADGVVLLDEDTTFTFRRSGAGRSIDRVSRLTARSTALTLADNKEGFFGLRVARALEQPSLDDTGVTGFYRTNEGKEGDAVWGTRGRWAALSGHVGDEDVTILILDHPKNAGAPTYWHARGYGLFAANPLGQKVFSEGREELNLKIAPGRTVTFRYRVIVLPSTVAAASVGLEWKRFSEGQP